MHCTIIRVDGRFFNAKHRVLSNEGDLQVKTVSIMRPAASMTEAVGVIAVKGIGDDADYLTLGDYGKKFGDGESGVIMRAVYRQLHYAERPSPDRQKEVVAAYATRALHAAPIHLIRFIDRLWLCN